jgi:hypothetical protein
VTAVPQGRTWQGICVGIMGVALTLVPMSAASAHKPRHHQGTHTNGSAPNSSMCQDVKSEQAGAGSVGVAIEKAIASGNFAAAKAAMLNAYDADLGTVQKALGVIKTAPANVQAAFKNLLTFVQQIRNDIQNASSEQGLITSFSTLGRNPQLQTDGTTIANWYTSVCGGTIISSTTTSLS